MAGALLLLPSGPKPTLGSLAVCRAQSRKSRTGCILRGMAWSSAPAHSGCRPHDSWLNMDAWRHVWSHDSWRAFLAARSRSPAGRQFGIALIAVGHSGHQILRARWKSRSTDHSPGRSPAPRSAPKRGRNSLHSSSIRFEGAQYIARPPGSLNRRRCFLRFGYYFVCPATPRLMQRRAKTHA